MTTLTLASTFVTVTCCYAECSMTFALTADFNQRARDDGRWWYCPAGHRQHYTGETDAAKLARAEAQLTAARDQLHAATLENEKTRVALLRDRGRFANGVCPCCRRSFPNVQRHMTTQHPGYDVTRVADVTAGDDLITFRYPCSCGRAFDTLMGLRRHQTAQRRPGWDAPTTSAWSAHLTKVSV